MADAVWVEDSGRKNIRTCIATINSTDVKTAVLKLNPFAKERTIFINIGATEAALQIKGHNKVGAVEADQQVLIGADAIAADYDDRISMGVTTIQVTGAVSANDTVITVTEVI